MPSETLKSNSEPAKEYSQRKQYQRAHKHNKFVMMTVAQYEAETDNQPELDLGDE
jgi:hypothetical protein